MKDVDDIDDLEDSDWLSFAMVMKLAKFIRIPRMRGGRNRNKMKPLKKPKPKYPLKTKCVFIHPKLPRQTSTSRYARKNIGKKVIKK